MLSAIIADEAAIGVVATRPRRAHHPVPGAKVGDTVEFGGLLGRVIVMDAGKSGCERLIARGGNIPAPLQGIRN